MNLTAMTLLESTRRKFFMNWAYIGLESRDETFLGSGGRNESNCHELARIGEQNIFYELDVHHV